MDTIKKYLYIVLLVFFWSCEEGADGITGQDGTDGLSTILYTLDEPSGDNCANGGAKIVYGIDVNSDGVWIGSSYTINVGASIENDSIIASGSVVMKGKFPENVIIVGVLGKVIREL